MSQNLSLLTDQDLCQRLSGKIDALPAKDQTFAASLIASVAGRLRQGGQASDKQRHWLETLAKRAEGDAGAAERVKSAIGDLSGINELFDRAKRNLKAPAVVIGMAGQEVRLSVAGDRARVPGSINVALNGGDEWYGRILQTGHFEASPRIDTPTGLIADLHRFAADPAGVAAEHGRLTGKCCFCNIGLKDERSTAVGYGPTCAEKWGQPYPTKAEARAAHQANLFAA